MSDQPPPPPQLPTPLPASAKPTITIELPGDLEPIYANTAIITHSASELILDFAQVMPNTPKAKIHARLVMTPMNAKLLLRALGENLSKFEGVHGEIKLPDGMSLADYLFKPPKG